MCKVTALGAIYLFRVCLQTPGSSRIPYRTPKSVRRGGGRGEKLVVQEDRILGTPDYLAPEILRRQEHGKWPSSPIRMVSGCAHQFTW